MLDAELAEGDGAVAFPATSVGHGAGDGLVAEGEGEFAAGVLGVAGTEQGGREDAGAGDADRPRGVGAGVAPPAEIGFVAVFEFEFVADDFGGGGLEGQPAVLGLCDRGRGDFRKGTIKGDGDDGVDAVRDGGGEDDFEPALGGGGREARGGVGEEAGRDGGVGDEERELAVFRPGEDVEIKGAVLAGDAAPGRLFFEWGGGGAVDGLAVDGEPAADRGEALDAGRGDEALGGGTDIEEEIAALAGDVGEVADERLGGFPAMVVFLEAPGAGTGSSAKTVGHSSEEKGARRHPMAAAGRDRGTQGAVTTRRRKRRDWLVSGTMSV